MSSRVLVCLPTYEERDSVLQVIADVLECVPHAHVVVGDDTSPDGTAQLVCAAKNQDPRIHLVTGPRRSGLRATYRRLLQWGLAHGYDYFIQCDADGSHRGCDVERIANAAPHWDLVVGSRYVAGGSTTGWSPSRRWLSWVANRYAAGVLGSALCDWTSGLTRLNRAAAEIFVRGVRVDGYGFQIEFKHQCIAAGLRVTEVPIAFANRMAGASKMRWPMAAEAAWVVARLGLRQWCGDNRARSRTSSP